VDVFYPSQPGNREEEYGSSAIVAIWAAPYSV